MFFIFKLFSNNMSLTVNLFGLQFQSTSGILAKLNLLHVPFFKVVLQQIFKGSKLKNYVELMPMKLIYSTCKIVFR